MRRKVALALPIDAFSGNTLLCGSQAEKYRGFACSHSKQVGIEFGVSAFLRPEVERDGGKFIDDGVGESVLGEVNGFQVGPACVATLNANVRKGLGSVNGKLGVVFLAATGTHDAAKLPLGEAEATEQVAAGAIAQLAKNA